MRSPGASCFRGPEVAVDPYLIAAAWIGLALIASLVSIRVGVSVALIEIAMGVIGGNFLGFQTNPWIDFLATFGSGLLTFLAGAEIDPDSLRRHIKISMSVGVVAFFAPFLAAFGFAYFVAGWNLGASEIAGIALSTTSVAVVYAVMIESGLAETEIGKVILAACFINDLGTVLALGVLFADFSPLLLVFIVVTAISLYFLPAATRWFVRTVPNRVSEPEIKFIFFVLLALGGLANTAKSEAVLPAYLVGLAIAGVFVRDRVLVHRMRAIAFSILTPFYFIKAGLFVQLPAVVSGVGLIVAFFLTKVGSKVVSVWPTSRVFGMPLREANYTTLMMSTGLTFGTISALFGLTNHIIDQSAYTILVTVVILSAVIPTLIATTFFEPRVETEIEAEEIEAADEIDTGFPRRRAVPPVATEPGDDRVARRGAVGTPADADG